MKHALQRTLGLATVAIFLGGVLLVVPEPATAATAPMKFGMDVGAVDPMTKMGAKPDYATMWVGVWTLNGGWGGVDAQLDKLYASGVTPVIHYYYWGNDISQNCLENGCWSTVHNAHKSKAGWQSLGQQLVDHLDAHMKGRAAVVVLETEFNKNDVATYEALDGYLAQKAGFVRSEYPAAQVVLGFGNWGSTSWGTFDRAAAASKYVGIQGMRGATRDSATSYANVVNALLASTKTLKTKFAKPVFITDVALSSHWEPEWLSHQSTTMKSLMSRRAEFKSAGATAIVYRGLYDAPNANIKEYYGEGERHFGLAWSYNKTAKPALKPWIAAIKAERGATSSTSTTGLSATFTPKALGTNWVEVQVTSPSTIAKTYAKINSGPWYLLIKQSSGTWGRSLAAPEGATVVFRTFNSAGAYATSSTYRVPLSDALSATFTPASVGNNWWVETKVTSSSTITKTYASINGGPWYLLEKTSWGTWARSLAAPNGASVKFRTFNAAGQYATSPTYTWT